MELFDYFAIVIGAMILVCIYLIITFPENKRTKDLQKVAGSLNFTFCQRDDDLLSHMTGFNTVHPDGKIRIRNIMRGSANDVDITIMDCWYRVDANGGGGYYWYKQTAILFNSALPDILDFTLEPKGIVDKIGDVFSIHGIDFDRHPKFSKQYQLLGPDKNAIRSVFGDNLLSYYESAEKGIVTEVKKHKFLFYRYGKKVRPRDIKAFMEEALHVFSMMKAG